MDNLQHAEPAVTGVPDLPKSAMSHVEDVTASVDKDKKLAVVGTVKLTEGGIVYIPTPTADPRGKFSFLLRISRSNSTDMQS